MLTTGKGKGWISRTIRKKKESHAEVQRCTRNILYVIMNNFHKKLERKSPYSHLYRQHYFCLGSLQSPFFLR